MTCKDEAAAYKAAQAALSGAVEERSEAGNDLEAKEQALNLAQAEYDASRESYNAAQQKVVEYAEIYDGKHDAYIKCIVAGGEPEPSSVNPYR